MIWYNEMSERVGYGGINMSDDRNKFEPMYNIPSMEELDRQWKESQGSSRRGQSRTGRSNTTSRSNSASARGAQRAGNTIQRTARQRTGGAQGRTSSGQGTRSATGRTTTGRSTGSAAGRTVAGRNATGRNATGRSAAGQDTVNNSAVNNTGGSNNTNAPDSGKGSKKRKKGKKPKKFKKLRLFIKIFFLIMLLAILGVLVVFYFKFGDDLLRWKREAKQLVEQSSKDTFCASETSFIYAANKKPIARLKGDKDTDYISFDEIPQAAIDCMVATEDRDFYEHSGINFLSTAKAGFLYVKGKLMGDDSITRGGSTITQQLAKNVFLSNEQTEERKIREMFIAIEMERKYTKDEIMEFYLNNICFANAHFGIEAASKAYFSRSVKELSLPEIAFLCAIPNIPTYYDPLQHFDHTQSRKERVLNQLLEAGKISAAEYSDAVYEEIVLKPAEAIKTQDYMTTYAITCATKELMKKKGFEFQYEFSSEEEEEKYKEEYNTMYEECHSALYTGGYQIYTSLSSSKQKKLQKAVNQTLSEFKEKTKEGIYTLQGAATCIDNETGFVVAIVGGRKQKDTVGYTLNRAFQSYRQPGSSFKPLVVYTPQLERGYTPNTIVDDTYFEDGPHNSDGTYAGKIPLRTAVEKSKNVVAWKLFEELSPKVGLSYVKKMGFSQIVANDYYPAASLGGLTNGASTVEMASGFATIENDGVYREPTCIKKILDGNDKVVISNLTERDQRQIYEENAARTMTDILTGVLIRGTAAGKGLTNMPCAGKTGTTSDKKDGWFCGFTPYYTLSVWVGYDSPKTLSTLYGNTYPLTIWRTFMEEIHQNLERKEFIGYEESSGKKKDDYDYDDSINETTEEPEVTEKPEKFLNETPEPTEEPEKTEKPTPEPVIDDPGDDVPDDVPDNNDPGDDVPDDDLDDDAPDDNVPDDNVPDDNAEE